MLYRTDDATRWGTGKGANLTPTEIDLNFWEVAQRLVAVEGGGASANGISTITVAGSQMTIWLEDGTSRGPFTLPSAMIRYRGDWITGAAYAELDLVAVTDSGIYLVLRDHTAAAIFDANATDAEANPLYRWLFAMGSSVRALTDLSDVTITTPAAGQVVRYDGAGWVNAAVAWADIPDKPATFTPAAHGHDWSEIGGRPATIDALPATVGAAGAVLKAQADGSIAWGADETGAGGGAATFLELTDTPAAYGAAGQIVAVSGTGDALIFTDPPAGSGGIADAPIDGSLYGRRDGTWQVVTVSWGGVTDKPATFPPSAHAHAVADIGDFAEGVDDRVSALLVAGANITLTYDDATGALTIASSGGAGATALGDLSGVTITTPAAAQVLQYDGAGWVNSPLGWAEIADRPATFPPSAHLHPASEISDFAEAVDDRVAALFVAGANITLTYDDAAGTMTVASSGSGSASVSDESVQVLAAPTDLNFAGAGVSVADDGDGTATVTIPGGVPEAPADGNLYGRTDGGWALINLPAPEGAYRYWRMRLTSENQKLYNGTTLFVRGIEFRQAPGTPEAPNSNPGLLTNSSGWTSPGNAVDGTYGTYARIENGGPFTDKYVGWVYDDPIVAQEFYVEHDSTFNSGPLEFAVEASDDGLTWIEVLNIVRASSVTQTWGISPPQEPVDATTVQGVTPSAFALTLLDDADAAAARTTLGAAMDKAPIETIAGAAYTAVAADAGKWKRTTDASPVTVTIAANVHAAEDEITFEQAGAGAITFAAGTGMTLNARGGALTSAGQFAVCEIKVISATEATLFGDIV